MTSDFPDPASGLVNVPDDSDDDSPGSEQHDDMVHRRLRFHTWEVCASYLVMFLFCTVLLKYTAFISNQLNAGDLAFKPKAILPTFRALLWLFAWAALVLICFNIMLNFFFSSNDLMNLDIYLALLYAGRHFMLVLAPSFMYQKSLSGAALMRSSLVTIGLTFGSLMLFVVPHFPSYVELYISFSVILLFFLRMALWPPSRASVAVMRRYAVFCLIHWRPHFAATVPDDIRELIESTWAEDTRARPTAAQVVKNLELIQQKSLAENLDCVGTAVDTSHLGAESSIYHEMIDGADAVRNLVSTNQVKRTWEGVRLGNAWMEAGFLHEEKHAAPFSNKPNMRYYFNTTPLQNDSIMSAADDESVIVIGMSTSTYDSRRRSHSFAPSRPKRCMCKMNARQVAAPRRVWKAFGTAESRAVAQHDFTLSSSYESLLTSVLLEDSEEE
uniref:Protein kinase domain-containing protein n=1 Tax=Globisporangium ultimum (strain ATCC 200006 / CBS 805.95 / DAOM BR144) TaxID=431595 RepID=K3WZF2_GLOUD